MSKKEAQAMADGLKKAKGKVVKGVKSYAKNVAGGAKIVGGAVKKMFKKKPKTSFNESKFENTRRKVFKL